MRTHFFIALMALIVSSCASRGYFASNDQATQAANDQYTFAQGQGPQFR